MHVSGSSHPPASRLGISTGVYRVWCANTPGVHAKTRRRAANSSVFGVHVAPAVYCDENEREKLFEEICERFVCLSGEHLLRLFIRSRGARLEHVAEYSEHSRHDGYLHSHRRTYGRDLHGHISMCAHVGRGVSIGRESVYGGEQRRRQREIITLFSSKVGGYSGLIDSYMHAVAENMTLNASHLSEQCGLPSKKAFTLLREPTDADYPWPGFIFGQTPSSIWYWAADQVDRNEEIEIETILQVMVQRALASKSLSHAQGATIFAGAMKILPLFIIVMPGMVARVLRPGITCRNVCSLCLSFYRYHRLREQLCGEVLQPGQLHECRVFYACSRTTAVGRAGTYAGRCGEDLGRIFRGKVDGSVFA